MKKKILLLAFCFLALKASAQFSVTGKLTEKSNNEALIGVNIKIKDSTKGTLSDINGKYKIVLEKGDYSLIFSFIGFKTIEKQFSVTQNLTFNLAMEQKIDDLEEVFVYATKNYPITKTEVARKELEKRNLGQDLPQLLNFTPSIVTTSDAGAGVGYTGMRIRGSDATRVNVTINGVPLNDSESQGTYMVNLPDLSSSVSNISIQRGVGTSVNGGGAFGGSVNISTAQADKKAYAEINNTFGSFNTWKHNLRVSTGLLKDKFSLDARLSQISSDGFIDRSASKLKSFFVTGTYYRKKATLSFNVFGGKEITHQAWYGTPEEVLATGNRTYNYYTYDNEIDNYQQNHYQLVYNSQLNSQLKLNTVVHYTKGKGYFEQFKEGSSFSEYGLDDFVSGTEIFTETDLIQQRWLDNDFYGVITNLSYQSSKQKNGSPILDAILGGGWNKYKGDHFGDVIWREYALENNAPYRYYFGQGNKKDFNIYLKANMQVFNNFFAFADLQIRKVNYEITGTDSDRRPIDRSTDFFFFNPKFGLKYFFSDNKELYATFAIANKEPNRGDYTDAPTAGSVPKSERLRNLEIGYSYSSKKSAFAINYYLMKYKNQLIPTGTLNDVGTAIRTNIAESYRTGIEFQAKTMFNKYFSWKGNVTLSQSKIKNFTESIVDYDNGGYVTTDLGETDIAFSPNTVMASTFSVRPMKGFEINLLSKYVGKQYLDNTSSDNRKIATYSTQDVRFSYAFSVNPLKKISINLLINNVLDTQYSSNGYFYAYKSGGAITTSNNYYPQAGRNFLLGLKLRI